MAEAVASERVALDPNARRIALIVASAFFIQHIDGAIINTSLPQMAASFAVQPVDINIGITAYLLSMAAFVPLGGWIADRFGAKHVFASAIVIFVVASIACGLSQTLWQFAAARIVQGAGAALMAPVGRIVVLRNTEKSSLIDAIALTVWPALIAPVIGPLIGGLITTYVDWRVNFLINIPLGAIELVLVLLFIPNHKESARTPFDVLGFLLSAAALMLLLYGLERLSLGGQDRLLAASLIGAGLVLGVLSVIHFRRHKTPLLDLTTFRTLTFRVATLDAGNTFRLAINATPFLLPLMLQVGFGLNPWQAGLYLLVYFAGNLSMKSVTTPTLRRFGFRNVMIGNGLAVAGTVAACGLLTPANPVAFDFGRAVRRRPHALDAVHHVLDAGVRRHRSRAAKLVVDDLQHVPAAGARLWRGLRGARARLVARRARRGRRWSRRFPRGVLRVRRCRAARHRHGPAPAARRRRGGQRP